MYILYNRQKYACKCIPSETMRYSGLPDDFPAPVVGDIVLCADDGFVLKKDNTADYLRQVFKNGILILTNVPEFSSQPEPTDTEPTAEERITSLEEALAFTDEAVIELYEAQQEQEQINDAQDEALIEIYELTEV